MFWVFILICLMVLWAVVTKGASMGKEVEYSYSDLFDKVQSNLVLDAVIQGDELKGHLKSSPKEEFHTTIGSNYQDLEKAMLASKVNVTIKEPQSNILLPLLFNVGPFVLLIAIWFFMVRQMQAGGNKALSFGKSRARLLSMQQKKITFKDVAGVDEAKEELKEIIEYLREPQKFQKLGGRIPKGVLLVGPPGTGKTLLARAVLTLLKCLWAWAQAAFATCLSRARRTPPASSSSTKLTPSAVIAAQVSAVVTMSASKPSTSCLLKWTDLNRMTA